MNMRNPTRNAHDQAIAYAWLQLNSTPFDGGRTEITFETAYRFEYQRDPVTGDPLLWNDDPHRPRGTDVPDGWSGSRRQSTEEGYDNLHVRVRRIDTDATIDEEIWIVEVGTDSRDCDGQYVGGWDVTFQAGTVPIYDNQERRDLTAEAAGY